MAVKVIDVDPLACRVSFSIKQLQQDPLTQTLDTVRAARTCTYTLGRGKKGAQHGPRLPQGHAGSPRGLMHECHSGGSVRLLLWPSLVLESHQEGVLCLSAAVAASSCARPSALRQCPRPPEAPHTTRTTMLPQRPPLRQAPRACTAAGQCHCLQGRVQSLCLCPSGDGGRGWVQGLTCLCVVKR